MITEQTTLNELFELAKASTNDVASNEIFIVKDLFRGFEWNRISKGNRTKLGSMYFSYAQNEGKHDILPLGKTPQNQQQYKKI
jgi:hypothetical protein